MDKTNSPPGSSPPLSPLNLKLSKYLRNRCPGRAGMDPSCLRGSYHHWVANPLTPPYQRAAGLITLLTTPSPSHIITRLLRPPHHPLPPYQQDDASASCPSGSTNHHGWTRADQGFGDQRANIFADQNKEIAGDGSNTGSSKLWISGAVE